MPSTLESEISATGLRRACLDFDMRAAFNRWRVSKNGDELALLVPDQLIMLLMASSATPSHPIWAYTETRLGRPLPKPE